MRARVVPLGFTVTVSLALWACDTPDQTTQPMASASASAEPAPPPRPRLAEGGKCKANDDCRPEFKCTADDHTCQTPTTIACRADDEACKKGGRCLGKDGQCVAILDGCKASEVCAKDGQCSAKDGQCSAVTNADCAVLCESQGLCIATKGKCIATKDAHCENSEPCKKGNFDRCYAKDGRCLSAVITPVLAH